MGGGVGLDLLAGGVGVEVPLALVRRLEVRHLIDRQGGLGRGRHGGLLLDKVDGRDGHRDSDRREHKEKHDARHPGEG